MFSARPVRVAVLVTGVGKAGRRAAGVVVYLALLVGMTSVYWGPNLLRSGRLVDAQAITSSRLDWRYNVLGADAYRTLRFGKPMTYGEVVRTLGVANLLIVDAKMVAKTVFYTVCMNPAVAALAAALGLFRRAGSLEGLRRRPASCRRGSLSRSGSIITTSSATCGRSIRASSTSPP